MDVNRCYTVRMTKKCCKCQQVKPVSEFYKDRSTWDGMCARCKICDHEKNQKWYEDHPEYDHNRHINRDKEHVLEVHRKWREANREYHNEFKLRYKKAHPEQTAAILKNWYQNNKDKSKMKGHNYRARKRANGGKITAQEWRWLKEFYNYTCLCCKKKEPEIKLTLDHVIPLALGGKNAIDISTFGNFDKRIIQWREHEDFTKENLPTLCRSKYARRWLDCCMLAWLSSGKQPWRYSASSVSKAKE